MEPSGWGRGSRSRMTSAARPRRASRHGSSRSSSRGGRTFVVATVSSSKPVYQTRADGNLVQTGATVEFLARPCAVDGLALHCKEWQTLGVFEETEATLGTARLSRRPSLSDAGDLVP